MLSVFGALGLLGGGALAAHAYSNSQRSVPNADAYGPVLWRNETTGTLFPETVGEPPNYQFEASDEKVAQWNRLGVSEDTSCSAGLSGGAEQLAEKLDCEAVLRATYIDLTGEMVATVAIIVLPAGGSAAEEMGEYLFDQSYEDPAFEEQANLAVVPLAVQRTLAEKWQEGRRNGLGGAGLGGNLPYAVAVTTGAVDGRIAGDLPGDFGSYGGSDDYLPWRDAADNLGRTFQIHLRNLER